MLSVLDSSSPIVYPFKDPCSRTSRLSHLPNTKAKESARKNFRAAQRCMLRFDIEFKRAWKKNFCKNDRKRRSSRLPSIESGVALFFPFFIHDCTINSRCVLPCRYVSTCNINTCTAIDVYARMRACVCSN